MAKLKDCVCGKCTDDPADALRHGWRYLVAHFPPELPPLTVEAQASALVSLLLNLSVAELQRHDDPRVRDSMRCIAARLELLADTPADQLEAMAQYLADQPRDTISRQ